MIQAKGGAVQEGYKRKYDIIVSAEEDFARAVALGVIVKRPVSAWHVLIPGMFILDFLRRSSEIRRYTSLFLFPRKLALDVAQEASKGGDRKAGFSRTEEKVRGWLTSLKLSSSSLHRRQMEAINVLIDHYSKLLDADGNSYHSLVTKAYKTRQNYEAFLSQLASVEKAIDRSIAETLGETQDVWGRLQAEETQVGELRQKEVDKIFVS